MPYHYIPTEYYDITLGGRVFDWPDGGPVTQNEEHTPETEFFSSEERLWLAVLINAIRDLAGIVIGEESGGPARRARQDAADWFNSNSPREGGFVWVCELLDLDRQTILKFLHQPNLKQIVRKAGPIWGRLLYPREFEQD